MDELIDGVGAVDRAAALRALITWIDLGVIKEDEVNTFRLLEVAEEAAPSSRIGQSFFASHLLMLTAALSFGCCGGADDVCRPAATGGPDAAVLEGEHGAAINGGFVR